MTTTHTETLHGYDIRILVDEHCADDSPRYWCNVGVMVMDRRGYALPNEANIDFSAFGSWEEVTTHLLAEHDAAIVLPVSCTDHSGISYYIGAPRDPWDSGQVGLIFVTHDSIAKEWADHGIENPMQVAADYLKQEVETYNQWASGDVYGYIVEKNGEHIDSCWGMYGMEYCLSEARAIVEAEVDALAEAGVL